MEASERWEKVLGISETKESEFQEKGHDYQLLHKDEVW